MTSFPTSPDTSTPAAEERLSPDTLQLILRERAWEQHRVVCMDSDQGPIVMKGQRPARGPARYRLLNLVASALNAPYLKAAPAWGGARAQEVEVRRLRSLRALGLPVPQVLHVEQEFFVMESLGEGNLAHTMQSHPQCAFELWCSGGDLLLQVHAKGQYLSQAFARNFVMRGTQLGLIDFEDDPLEVMSLPEAQVRDWLAYLHSTAWLLPAHEEAITQLERWLRSESGEVRALMRRSSARLSWMRRLPSSRKPWGRDVVSIQAVGQLLHAWMRQTTA